MNRKIKVLVVATLIVAISGVGVMVSTFASSSTSALLVPPAVLSPPLMDKTLMSENPRETADDVMITVNLAFRNWLVQSGKLVEAYVHRNNPEVGEQLVAQFLRDRPEYKKYIEKYTSMMQQQHFRDFMKEKSSYDPKMIIEKGKLTREWAYNTTINGTEFTVFASNTNWR
ncbi:MAG: hypothetical protein Q6352_018315 [Candidatus Freyrarchaeum guaymaensis]